MIFGGFDGRLIFLAGARKLHGVYNPSTDPLFDKLATARVAKPARERDTRVAYVELTTSDADGVRDMAAHGDLGPKGRRGGARRR